MPTKLNRQTAAELRKRLDGSYTRSESLSPIATTQDSTATAGRPRVVVDERTLAGLAAIQCTYLEMAAVLGVDESTLRTHYKDLIEKEREGGKISLRRSQYSAALKGNVTMQIWLGKQYLGQRDKQDVDVAVAPKQQTVVIGGRTIIF
jgi:hypothetical protein